MHVYVHIYIPVNNTCTLLYNNVKYADANLDAPDNVYLYVYGCICVNVCLYMCTLFYILSDCVCFMDYDI